MLEMEDVGENPRKVGVLEWTFHEKRTKSTYIVKPMYILKVFIRMNCPDHRHSYLQVTRT